MNNFIRKVFLIPTFFMIYISFYSISADWDGTPISSKWWKKEKENLVREQNEYVKELKLKIKNLYGIEPSEIKKILNKLSDYVKNTKKDDFPEKNTFNSQLNVWASRSMDDLWVCRHMAAKSYNYFTNKHKQCALLLLKPIFNLDANTPPAHMSLLLTEQCKNKKKLFVCDRTYDMIQRLKGNYEGNFLRMSLSDYLKQNENVLKHYGGLKSVIPMVINCGKNDHENMPSWPLSSDNMTPITNWLKDNNFCNQLEDLQKIPTENLHYILKNEVVKINNLEYRSYFDTKTGKTLFIV